MMNTFDTETLGKHVVTAASETTKEGDAKNFVSFVLGPKMTETIIDFMKRLDFTISHDYASKFDSWYESAMGSQHSYSKGMPFMAPHVALTMVLCYLAFVFIGVQIVKRSGGIKVKPIMRLYNLFMVLLSFYMGSKSIQLAIHSHPGKVFCLRLAKDGLGHEMARLSWLFTYSKVIEFLDTVFMIVECRLRQISFLHVYHHITVLAFWFSITWSVPGADGYFSLAGNSFIHVAMYGYYLVSSFGYSPWWKYYITKAQIFQFCVFCVQTIYIGYIKAEKDCDFPHILSRSLFWYLISLIALFAHFLVTNKSKKKKKIGDEKKDE